MTTSIEYWDVVLGANRDADQVVHEFGTEWQADTIGGPGMDLLLAWLGAAEDRAIEQGWRQDPMSLAELRDIAADELATAADEYYGRAK